MVPVPALAGQGKVVQGPDFSNQSRDRDLAHLDTYGHGTHVAGIIAGNDPTSGFRGVAPDARLVNVKAAGADGSTTLASIVASVGWVIAHRSDNGLHVRVLNLSFGTPPSRYQSDLLAYATEAAWNAGIVVVVSAGNEGDKHRGLTSPGYDPFILAVGADDLSGTADVNDDVVPDWSGRGNGRNPDLVAPGRSIASLRDPSSSLDLAHPEARVGDALLKGSGTSQAAAVVSGAVALMLERRPDLSPDQVKAIIKSNADPLSGPGPDAQGAGRLNVTRALAAPSPDPAAARQLFEPATVRGVVAKLVSHLGKGRQAEVGPVSPDGKNWGGAKWGGAKWGGAKWGGSSWGGSSWGGSSWGGSSWGGSSWGGSSWGGSSWGGSSWGGSSWGGSSWGDG
jgi:serine protease AprX